MRLFNIQTGQFELWADPRAAHYAILSHTWDEFEMSYQDLRAVRVPAELRNQPAALLGDPPLIAEKLRTFFKVALEDGFELVWADTCCIDKTHRSELVEAMNSMFDWYGYASACYVLLSDVPPLEESLYSFHQSRWFYRTWTLQELLAPRTALFFANDWTLIGSKHTLLSHLEKITKIDSKVLTSQVTLDNIPVAQRMAWASRRECTRLEDEAYSMMGILGVNMQIAYGEGKLAFFRLQVEVLRRYSDQTILAWHQCPPNPYPWLLDNLDPASPWTELLVERFLIPFNKCRSDTHGDFLLAHGPHSFHNAELLGVRLTNLSPAEFTQKLGITTPNRFYPLIDPSPENPLTIRITLPVVTLPDVGECALVACEDSQSRLVGIPLLPSWRATVTSDLYHSGYPNVQIHIPQDLLQSLGLSLQPPEMRPVLAVFPSLGEAEHRTLSFPPPAIDSSFTFEGEAGVPYASGRNTGHLSMRLLGFKSGRFKVVREPPGTVPYAILSHVWSRGVPGEQTYSDVCALQEKYADGPHPIATCGLPGLSEKLRQFCQIASEDGYEFGWADTCCIDKGNPHEVEEAIPAMFNWYAQSGACYVILHDVKSANWRETFSESEWFERGWTLQELLAPRKLIFLTSDWVRTGTLIKAGRDDDLVDNSEDLQTHQAADKLILEVIIRATRIPLDVLIGKYRLADVPIAQRLSWAASRKTTRVEDLAYSMMDIVHVNIPVAYGEGRYAFIRLQEEALKRDPDQTVFAWGCFLDPPDLPQCPADTAADSSLGRTTHAPTLSQFMLAPSPREFQKSFAISRVPQEEFSRVLGVAEHDISQTFTSTPYGIRARLPLLNLQLGHPPHPEAASYTHLALLSVVQFDQRSQSRQFLALLLRPHNERGGPPEYLVGIYSKVQGNEGVSQYIRATLLSAEQLAEYSSKWAMTDVYIPHYPSRTIVDLEYNAIAHDNLCQAPAPAQFTVRLCGWSERLLELQDFACEVSSLQDGFHVFTIPARDGRGVGHKPRLEGLRILVGRCECGVKNSKLGPLAVRLEVPSL